MLSKTNFSDAFKWHAVEQLGAWGYPVSAPSKRLRVSQLSLDVWKSPFAKPSAPNDVDKLAVICCLKRGPAASH